MIVERLRPQAADHQIGLGERVGLPRDQSLEQVGAGNRWLGILLGCLVSIEPVESQPRHPPAQPEPVPEPRPTEEAKRLLHELGNTRSQ